jgi:endonuclease G
MVHDRPLQTAVISRDGRRVATLDIEGIARIWHVASAAQILPALDPAAGKNRRVPPLAEIYPRTPHGLAFAPDERSLLLASTGQALTWSTLTPVTPVSSIKGYLLDAVGALRRLPEMEQENLAALRRQLLAIDERTLQTWKAGAAADPAPPVEVPEDITAPPGVPERPRRAAVAIIDDGIDVLHETFVDDDGRSRIVAIWDQKDTSGPPPEGFTYGRLHTAEDIAGYVRRQSVPEALGRNVDGHGTHVASVAAGRRIDERFNGGLAWDAAIVAVVVNRNSASMLDALSFVDRVAARIRLPLAISLSVDQQSGGRDGKSEFEVGVDAVTEGGRKPGRVVVSPAGNRRGRRQHATVDIRADAVARLGWTSDSNSVELELWAAPENSYRFRLAGPDARRTAWVDSSQPDLSGAFDGGGQYYLSVTKRHVDNGDTRFVLRLENLERVGSRSWQLEIEAQTVASSNPIQAWIGSDSGNVEFGSYVSDEITLAVPATARTVIAVGAADTNQTMQRAAQFSSCGPTRDGREKPDVSAPGVGIRGAKAGTSREVTEMSGTSMAAAHVTGMIALLFEQGGTDPSNWPTANQISAALRQTAQGNDGQWDPALGYGVVDARAFIAALSRQLA